jgi:hypothetical protein
MTNDLKGIHGVRWGLTAGGGGGFQFYGHLAGESQRRL